MSVYQTLVVALHALIFIPSVIYFIWYSATRRWYRVSRLRAATPMDFMLDASLLGTPVVCIAFTMRTLLGVYIANPPLILPERSLTDFSAIFSLALLFLVGAIMWSLLFAMALTRARAAAYREDIERAVNRVTRECPDA